MWVLISSFSHRLTSPGLLSCHWWSAQNIHEDLEDQSKLGQLVTLLLCFINSRPMNLSGMAPNEGRCIDPAPSGNFSHPNSETGTFLSAIVILTQSSSSFLVRLFTKCICPFVMKVVLLFYNFVPQFPGDSGHCTLFLRLLVLTEPPCANRTAHEKSLTQLHLSRPALNREFIYLKSRY